MSSVSGKRTRLAVLLAGLVVFAVLGAVVGAATAILVRPRPGPAAAIASEPVASASASPFPPPSLEASPARSLPPGWAELPSAPPSSTLTGLQPGTLAFRSADGALLAFAPPSANPDPGWQTVSSHTDGYTLQVPPDWKVETATLDGHDLFTLVPPGVDPSAQMAGGPPLVTVAWNTTTPTFDLSSGLVSRLPDTDTPVPGTQLVTFGGIEFSVVAAIPHRSGWVVVLGLAATDSLLNDWTQIVASWKAT